MERGARSPRRSLRSAARRSLYELQPPQRRLMCLYWAWHSVAADAQTAAATRGRFKGRRRSPLAALRAPSPSSPGTGYARRPSAVGSLNLVDPAIGLYGIFPRHVPSPGGRWVQQYDGGGHAPMGGRYKPNDDRVVTTGAAGA